LLASLRPNSGQAEYALGVLNAIFERTSPRRTPTKPSEPRLVILFADGMPPRTDNRHPAVLLRVSPDGERQRPLPGRREKSRRL